MIESMNPPRGWFGVDFSSARPNANLAGAQSSSRGLEVLPFWMVASTLPG